MKLIEAPIAGGKTTMIAKTSVNLAKKGNAVLVLTPTHEAGSEVINLIRKHSKVDNSMIVVQLMGKRPETIFPTCENTTIKNCSRCKKAIKNAAEIKEENAGVIFDLPTLQERSTQYSICAHSLGRILSQTIVNDEDETVFTQGVVVVSVTAYLTSKTNRKILELVRPSHIFIDEADTLFDLLLSSNSKAITIMSSRTNKNSINQKCPENCNICRRQYADRMTKYVGLYQTVDKYDQSPYSSVSALKENITSVKEAVEKGILKAEVFDFIALYENIDELYKILQTHDPKATPAQYLNALIKHNKAFNFFPDRGEKGEFGITLNGKPVLTEKGEGLFNSLDTINDYDQNKNVIEKLYVDKKKQKTDEGVLRAFLTLVEIFRANQGKVLLLPQIPNQNNPVPCGIKMVALDEVNYKNTILFLTKRNSTLLSGTFLAQSFPKALFLGEEIDYKNLKTPLHKQVAILIHNPTYGRKQNNRFKSYPIDPISLTHLYKRITDAANVAKVLHFAVSSLEGNILFKQLINNPSFSANYRIENHCRLNCEVDDKNMREKQEEEALNHLVIDKLRSPSSRGVNRAFFNICVVYGNGYPDWSSYYLLHWFLNNSGQKMEMEDLILYNRDRAVVQALLRAPRDEFPTVCLYIGDMTVESFPEDIRHRVITINQLCRATPGYGSSLENQLKVISNFITGFLSGDKDSFLNPVKEKTIEEDSTFSEQEEYLVNLWVEQSKKTNANITRYTKQRIKHVKAITENKGVLKLKKDAIGRYPTWKSFINFLEEYKYIVQSEGGYQRC